MAHHHLKASVANCHWGYFDAKRAPVLTVNSGDHVTVDTVSGSPAVVPSSDFYVPPELREIHAQMVGHPMGPHILTGPVAIEGARPGHVLEVQILEVNLRQNWGYNAIRPLAGTLPDDFPDIPLDLARNVATLPWGLELPLRPFFGILGVAPPPNWGRITSIVPRSHGGNIDNKELVPGATLYLPIFAEGGLFSCGDGHAAQGDGEVCLTAIETALQGTFQLIVRDDIALNYPRAETPTHYITMGMDPDLDQCAVVALRDMLRLITEKTNLSREEAYTLCSIAADLRVTQTVNGSKGIHVMLAKSLLQFPQPM
jgi:acetamidase/formamidase